MMISMIRNARPGIVLPGINFDDIIAFFRVMYLT